jgi:hypothetical protein
MSEKHKSASPNAIEMKNQWKTISIEEKLDVISWIEKAERIIDICRNVSFTHSSVCTSCDIADRITESAKSGNKAFVNHTRNYGCESHTLLFN